MGWLFVSLAAISEIAGVVGLKMYSQKKTIKKAILYFGGFGASFAFLYASFHYLQLSVAYAVWVGVGTAGAVLVNMLFFNESKSFKRIVSILFIIAGVIGLKALS